MDPGRLLQVLNPARMLLQGKQLLQKVLQWDLDVSLVKLPHIDMEGVLSALDRVSEKLLSLQMQHVLLPPQGGGWGRNSRGESKGSQSGSIMDAITNDLCSASI